MKKLSLLAMSLLMTIALFAQKEETIFGKSGLRLSGAWGGSSTNISQIEDNYAVYSGGFGGLEFNRSVFIGWGGYKLVSDVLIGDVGAEQNLEMDYNGLIFGYALKPHKPIHATFMLMGGKGDVQLGEGQKDKIFVVKPSAGLELNVFRWFHIGLRGGYRIVTDSDIVDISDTDLSGFFGEANLKFGISWNRGSKDRRNQERNRDDRDTTWP
ncbi:MAG: hypothetical protein ACI9VN_001713 [Patescibacteria group bacterium]|jgi:hypothetical protein